MSNKKTISKMFATATMIAMAATQGIAQDNTGVACGCPTVSSRPSVNLSTLAVNGGALDGDLLGNTILDCSKLWVLDKKIYVPDGLSITIQAGTVIKALEDPIPGNADALIVTRGGKIFANGNEDCPIVFTSINDPMNGTYGVGNRGKWGGVVLLGRASNNLTTANVFSGGVNGVGFIEGFSSASTRNLYGMPAGQTDDNDNSGVMQYVSIRHAGKTVGPDNELNGLTCGSVGRGTTLRYIEVIANDDDGLEFFGGTVDIKYAAVMANLDDAFDFDLGWRGRGQFLFLVQNASGDNGVEADGDDDKTCGTPLSHPFLYNVTCIGNGGDVGIEAKELTEGEVYNSVFANFGSGLNMIKSLGTRACGTSEVWHNWNAGSFKVNNCTFVGTTNALTVGGSLANVIPADQTKFAADGNTGVASVPGFDFAFAINNTTNAVTDTYDAIPEPALGTVSTPPTDGFFTNANYRGAFQTGAQSWMNGWSYYAATLTATAGLKVCPTDINGDGATTNADFLQLLGEFNQSCD